MIDITRRLRVLALALLLLASSLQLASATPPTPDAPTFATATRIGDNVSVAWGSGYPRPTSNGTNTTDQGDWITGVGALVPNTTYQVKIALQSQSAPLLGRFANYGESETQSNWQSLSRANFRIDATGGLIAFNETVGVHGTNPATDYCTPGNPGCTNVSIIQSRNLSNGGWEVTFQVKQPANLSSFQSHFGTGSGGCGCGTGQIDGNRILRIISQSYTSFPSSASKQFRGDWTVPGGGNASLSPLWLGNVTEFSHQGPLGFVYGSQIQQFTNNGTLGGLVNGSVGLDFDHERIYRSDSPDITCEDATLMDTLTEAGASPWNDTNLSGAHGVFTWYVQGNFTGGAYGPCRATNSISFVGPLPNGSANLTATPGDTLVLLSWTNVTNATTYGIWRYADDSPPSLFCVFAGTCTMNETPWEYQANMDALAAIDSNLTNGQPYSYVVVPANDAGEGTPSNVATATPQVGLTIQTQDSSIERVIFLLLFLLVPLILAAFIILFIKFSRGRSA